MKVLYLEAKKKEKQSLPISIAELPKELFLAYSIQYKQEAEAIKKQLESNKFKISGFQQVLGCSKLKSRLPILLIGSGKFHALNLALQNKVPVFIYNNSVISEIDQKDIEKLKQKTKAALNIFFSTGKIGILVSTKAGQENLKQAEQLKIKIESKFPEKRVYILVSNHINISEFENFDIGFFINTACPGLLNDSPKIINTEDILSFLCP